MGSLTLVLGASVVLAGFFGHRAWRGPRLAANSVPLLVPAAITLGGGIHLLGGLEPSAAYVVETSEGLVLVDSGLQSDAQPLKSQMAKLGLDWKGLRAVLLTHAHGDHCGGAEHLRAATGAKVFAGVGDAAVLKAGGPREAFFSTFYRPHDQPHPTTVDVELDGGESITFGDVRFRALAMPGHTPGSICYLMERSNLRALFAGDVILMLAGDEQPHSQKRKPLGTYSAYLSPRYRGDAKTYLSSLRELRALPVPDLVLPGHPAADPTPQSPCLTRARWARLLDQGIRDLETLLDRYETDGPDFLDGDPKRLLPDLYYLGDFKGATVYGFFASSQFFLVDAPGGPGLIKLVKTRLEQLGREPVNPTAVLLTACGGEQTAGLSELVEQCHPIVVAPAAGLERIRKSCPAGTAVLSAEQLPDQGWFKVTTLPLRGRGLAPTAYQVQWADKTVLFSGRIPIQAKSEIELELFSEISKSREATIDYLISVNQLSDLKPDLWLPAVSADGQNANVYDGEWQDLIAYNYRVGYLGLNGPR
ncbi:MAG: MBL fold metallo-hydrolase [Isosphaerales bacterium]